MCGFNEAVKEGRLRCLKVAGERNIADLMTKNFTAGRIRFLLREMGHETLGGASV